MHNLRSFFDAGEAVVEAGISVGEALMVEAHEVKDGGMRKRDSHVAHFMTLRDDRGT